MFGRVLKRPLKNIIQTEANVTERITQLVTTCLKPTIETLENGVKYVQS